MKDKKRKLRKCGECSNYHFDWEKKWCSAGEEHVISSSESGSYWNTEFHKYCDNHTPGQSNNHEW